MPFPFQQVDVFSAEPGRGNALAVVAEADGLSDERMASFARWTNLSETTFLVRPTQPDADYRVRIFTPTTELPFAGHPTLGSCHVWLKQGGVPQAEGIVQECGVGSVRIRRDGPRLAFAAPPLRNSAKPDEATLNQVCRGLGIDRAAVCAAQHVDNGVPWIAVRLQTRQEVLAIRPDYASLGILDVGVVAPWDPAADWTDAQFEVRAIVGDPPSEDPVTGSLNAGLAMWLIGEGVALDHYVASQGTVLGRRGRVHVDRAGDTIWVGGEVHTLVAGTLRL
ncbi:MAG: PhzF family phenazine biosynthesis protein [Candidatus Dormibacteraceae bacterium]